MSKIRDAWAGLILSMIDRATMTDVPAFYRYVRAMRALGADPIEGLRQAQMLAAVAATERQIDAMVKVCSTGRVTADDLERLAQTGVRTPWRTDE